MKRAFVLILLFSLVSALCGCAVETQAVPSEQPTVTISSEVSLPPAYDGEIPESMFGVFDEETYTNEAFGVKYLRDGRWAFYTMQELASLNGIAGETLSERLKASGFIYDMYARNELETLGLAIAIPAVQFGKAMTEEEYAQAVKDASARDYAGADYDVISDEVSTAEFGGKLHACFYMTAAASGLVFHTAQIFIQQDDFIGIIYVSGNSEESRDALLRSFSST